MKNILKDIEIKGYSVTKNFLPAEMINELANDILKLNSKGQFFGARLGKETEIREDIRGDKICWLDSLESTPLRNSFLSIMEELRNLLNEKLFLGLFEFEFHYAIYELGTFYSRHRDVFRGDDSRVLSAILYLNTEWLDQHGGQLILYPENLQPVVVEPMAGTFVCFLSHLEHEVKESHAIRKSCTGWFKKRQAY